MSQPLTSPELPLPPHEVERAVMQRLQSHPTLHFSRLSVHQCSRDSVCIEGILDSNEQDIDLSDVVRGIHGINVVVNHVLSVSRPVPKKG
ncbi:MAG: hypothetical protein JSS49_27055 [Planctomycetes bacterium]|nr:hypothetical protein [Planctomycetota bacterium]